MWARRLEAAVEDGLEGAQVVGSLVHGVLLVVLRCRAEYSTL
jgi:hypothetical protein